MITNDLNLPQPFVDAAKSNHTYKPNRYSVTEVLGGTCEAVLKRRHHGEQDEDVSDCLWAVLGTAVHKVLEQSKPMPGQHREEWMCVEVDVDGITYYLSGIPDLYEEDAERVTDYKVTSVWQAIFGDYERWRRQTLLYCYMLRRNGHRASKGQVVAMLRDHSQRKAMTDREYPSHPVKVTRWEFSDESIAEAEKMVARWFLDVAAQEQLPDDELEPCSPEQRWHKDDKWAVMRTGRKKALRLYDSAAEAQSRAYRENGNKTDGPFHVELRKGEDTKCERYCGVAQFCPYGRKFFQET